MSHHDTKSNLKLRIRRKQDEFKEHLSQVSVVEKDANFLLTETISFSICREKSAIESVPRVVV